MIKLFATALVRYAVFNAPVKRVCYSRFFSTKTPQPSPAKSRFYTPKATDIFSVMMLAGAYAMTREKKELYPADHPISRLEGALQKVQKNHDRQSTKDLCAYIEKNRREWEKKEVTELFKNRIIQNNPDGTLFIHYKADSDRSLGNGDKWVKMCVNYDTGEWFAATYIDQNIGREELKAYQLVKGVSGIVPVRYYSELGQGSLFITPWYKRGDAAQAKCTRREKELIATQVLHTIDQLRQKGVYYSDLTLENTLLEGHGEEIEAGLSGLNGIYTDGDPSHYRVETPFLAPEKERSEASTLQVWAIGVFLYKLYLGAFPTETSKNHLASDLPDNWFKEPEERTLEHLIWRMLQKDPEKRIPLKEIPEAFKSCKK